MLSCFQNLLYMFMDFLQIWFFVTTLCLKIKSVKINSNPLHSKLNRIMQHVSVQYVIVLDQTFGLCADQKDFIRCEKGTKIKIISAVYGRTNDKVCPYGNTNSRTCRFLPSEIKVKWSCNGYRTCHLHASKQIVGNPCSNISKYLQVKYRCMKGPDGGNCFLNWWHIEFCLKKTYLNYDIKNKENKICLIFR